MRLRRSERLNDAISEMGSDELQDLLYNTNDSPHLGELLSRAFLKMAGGHNHGHGGRNRWENKSPLLRLGK